MGVFGCQMDKLQFFHSSKKTKIPSCENLLTRPYNLQGNARNNNKEKPGISLVDLAYRRAKAAKGAKKAADNGKVVRTNKKPNNKSKPSSSSTHLNKSRPEEMKELFQSEMSEKKQKRSAHGGGGKKSSSFKSKSRYYFPLSIFYNKGIFVFLILVGTLLLCFVVVAVVQKIKIFKRARLTLISLDKSNLLFGPQSIAEFSTSVLFL